MTDLAERLRALIDRSVFALPPADYRDTLGAALAAVDENERLRAAARVVVGDLLEHWAECPAPPDAECAECHEWFSARSALLAESDDR